MKDEIRDHLDKNLIRVKNLVRIFDDYAPEKTKWVKDTDILRAATVFLHATLEDFLRSIAAWKLPSASAEVLNKIQLTGMGQNQKYLLGDLVRFSDKKVVDLIKLSIDTYLERSTYNNVTEISNLLRDIGIVVNNVNGTFSDLEKLMERRHQIVHRVDRKPKTGKRRVAK